jgi:prepilin-type N-terminal cleavage/methylation domain-containing protein
MNMIRTWQSDRPRAFTLVEMLVVIGIISILAALIVGVSGSISRKAKRDSTRLLLERIQTVLETYRGTYDQWPTVVPPDLESPAANRAANSFIADLLLDADAVDLRSTGDAAEIVDQNGDLYDASKPGSVPHVADAWGNDSAHWIHIVSWPGAYNRPAPDIWSSGPDGKTSYRRDDDNDSTVDESGDPGWSPEDDDIVTWTRK